MIQGQFSLLELEMVRYQNLSILDTDTHKRFDADSINGMH